jgi:uncharacterized protein YaeQ
VSLTATIYTFEIDLADADRSVYETLALRVARHPSESDAFLLTRLLAYCVEFSEGIEFSKGLSDPDEPALSIRDLTGTILTWIDIGQPDAARLHKAAKAARRVAVYTHKDPAQSVRQLAGAKIHRAETLELYAIDRGLLAELCVRLERRMKFALSIAERELFISIDDVTLSGAVVRIPLNA